MEGEECGRGPDDHDTQSFARVSNSTTSLPSSLATHSGGSFVLSGSVSASMGSAALIAPTAVPTSLARTPAPAADSTLALMGLAGASSPAAAAALQRNLDTARAAQAMVGAEQLEPRATETTRCRRVLLTSMGAAFSANGDGTCAWDWGLAGARLRLAVRTTRGRGGGTSHAGPERASADHAVRRSLPLPSSFLH